MKILIKQISRLLLILLCANNVLAEQTDRDKPVHLEADQVLIDDARQFKSFEGRVQLIQGTLNIQADRIEVREDTEGYQHLTATGHPAKFRQRYEGSEEYAEGYGERIEYDTRAETVDFYDRARVKRGQDEVQGARITYSTKTEVFKASGDNASQTPGNNRVRAVLQPKRDTPAETSMPTNSLDIQPSETLSPPLTQKH
ncbi:MAG: lipopolysaccharide transport periplasmic protein LptA [Gammaproteobacteria bacterium]|nr:lipopolysaccharide transport periplasmic protein LptA [Gammaproteobacteria bacterium]MBU1624865.1 lipopolysaccharide transport periplasmic protein LptA [Gammaproteobacteria bacterium]MBU1982709.1 lipopolysaccharide transport periplasmic protein LptA [Gammaproteobacteria bacterium]